MSRPFVLLLACAACSGLLTARGTSTPSPPIHVSTTPMYPGATLTLSVELQEPATGLLEVRFFGSATGAGQEPCVRDGAVCGGLNEPIEMGSARFFSEMKITSVAASMPSEAVPGATFMLQAFISSEAGAVVSEVASVSVTEDPKAAETTHAEPTARAKPVEVKASDPQTATECDQMPTDAAIAACNAGLTGDIRFCESIEDLDDVLFCFAMGRRSTDACQQILDEAYSARCMEELRALGTP